MLVRTYSTRRPSSSARRATGAAALPAPDPLPVAGAIVRLSHVFRQPVTVVAVLAMSDIGDGGRVAGVCGLGVVGGGDVGLGFCGSVVGSGGRCAGWLGGVCCVGGVWVGGCCAARLRPDIATMLHAARRCFFMVLVLLGAGRLHRVRPPARA